MILELKSESLRTVDRSCFTSILLLLFATPIFIETFSSCILSNSNSQFSNESKVIFFLATIFGQISFPIFSVIESGCIILPMFELNKTFKSIIEECLNTAYPLKNTFLCLFIACLICFLLSLIIYTTNQGKIFSKIPMNVIDSLMIASAIFNILIGLSVFKIEKRIVFSSILGFISFCITVLGIFILKKTNNPKMLILYVFLIICSFNLLKIFFDTEKLVQNKIFITARSDKLNVKLLTSAIHTGNFEYKVILKNILKILSIAISPLISLATALPFYTRQIGVTPKYSREMLAIGISNLVSSLVFSPVSFNCAGSTMFRLSGAKNRMHSILSGISLTVLYFTHHRIAPFLPRFAISFISQFIGFSVLFGYIGTILKISFLDKVVLFLTIAVALISQMNTIIVLISGMVITILTSMYFSGRFLSGNDIIAINEKNVVKIQPILDFRNIESFVETIKNSSDSITIDFTDTKYVDYTANSKLDQVLTELNNRGIIIEIIGKPLNLNIMKLK